MMMIGVGRVALYEESWQITVYDFRKNRSVVRLTCDDCNKSAARSIIVAMTRLPPLITKQDYVHLSCINKGTEIWKFLRQRAALIPQLRNLMVLELAAS